MAKLESNFRNMLLALTVISMVAAAALSSVFMLTKKPIENAAAKKSEEAIREILPSFDKIKTVTTLTGTPIYVGYAADEKIVGIVVEAVSENGFGGEVKVMVGFDDEGNVVNYSVLKQQETPGLGTKMTDWFKPQGETKKSLVERLFGFEVKAAERNSSIVGKNPPFTVKNDGGEIDAITASTISSRAFLDAVNAAYTICTTEALSSEELAKIFGATKVDTETGATKNAEQDSETGATKSNEDAEVSVFKINNEITYD